MFLANLLEKRTTLWLLQADIYRLLGASYLEIVWLRSDFSLCLAWIRNEKPNTRDGKFHLSTYSEHPSKHFTSLSGCFPENEWKGRGLLKVNQQ